MFGERAFSVAGPSVWIGILCQKTFGTLQTPPPLSVISRLTSLTVIVIRSRFYISCVFVELDVLVVLDIYRARQ